MKKNEIKEKNTAYREKKRKKGGKGTQNDMGMGNRIAGWRCVGCVSALRVRMVNDDEGVWWGYHLRAQQSNHHSRKEGRKREQIEEHRRRRIQGGKGERG